MTLSRSRAATRSGLVLLTVAVLGVSPLRAQAPQDLPRFSSGVEVTSVDANVLDGRGRPVPTLTADDFDVRVDGTARRVVSAEWVPLNTPERPATPPPPGFSTNASAAGGRLILLVVDQPNIRFGGTLGIRKAVNAFIDRLQPSDRTAVIGLGPGAPSTDFTSDRERLKRAIDRLNGQHMPRGMMLHNIGITEAMEIARGMPQTLQSVAFRECRDGLGRPFTEGELEACVFEIERESQDLARSGAIDGRETIQVLAALFDALRRIDGPKTLVFVSEGFMVDDMQQAVLALGTAATAARTSIYALKLDDTLFDMAASEARAPVARMDDRATRAEGLNLLVGASRGTLYNVMGTGANIFERIEAELGGYYLLGIESGPNDKDGKAHPIRIDVKPKGLTVRTRRAIIATPEVARRVATARDAVLMAMSAPLPIPALPLRLATYSLQGPESDRVQVLIHADVGGDYPQSRAVALAYTIQDREGRTLDSRMAQMRLLPVLNGVPSALQYSSGASLPPGEYTLKLAVAEGDRVGSIEHRFVAGVGVEGTLRLSDLVIGGPVNFGDEWPQPTAGYEVVFGAVQGYIEAYGSAAASLTAKYEVAASPDGDVLAEMTVPGRVAGRQRAIFSRLVPVRQLPEGPYVLRVTLSSPSGPVATRMGAFVIGRPNVLLTSATSPATVLSEVYLPVSELLLSTPFDASAAYAPATLSAFRSRVPAPQREAFDRGIEALSAGAFPEAERGFKEAVSADEDSSSALAYLAATFAASGHDTEAASAWQTALVDGSDRPEIYEWLSGALIRGRDLALARSVLEEAVGKWPSDVRFARPLALVLATFGQGADAMRALERHLDTSADDVESLGMAVEWLYQLKVANASAHSPREDRQLARRYADAYVKLKGPQLPLVRQWLQAIERN